MEKEEIQVKIKMKQSLAVILALVMVLSLSACGGKNSGPEEVGSYQLYEMTFEGDVFDHDFLETRGSHCIPWNWPQMVPAGSR